MTEIRAPYRDVRADQLSWAWGLEPRTPLARRAVTLPAHRLDLRLLGASHQVLVYGDDGLACSETIACEPGGRGRLPAAVTCSGTGWDYELHVTVSSESAADFARRCESITAGVAGHAAGRGGDTGVDPAIDLGVDTDIGLRGGLIGAFPGEPGAITAVLAEALPNGVVWRSWHCYPQTREIVATHSRFRVAP